MLDEEVLWAPMVGFVVRSPSWHPVSIQVRLVDRMRMHISDLDPVAFHAIVADNWHPCIGITSSSLAQDQVEFSGQCSSQLYGLVPMLLPCQCLLQRNLLHNYRWY